MLTTALQMRAEGVSLHDLARRLVITTRAKKGRHPSPPTNMRVLREHDDRVAADALAAETS
ncbi:hypothetical protein ACFXEL_27765 [Streptomyces sp. NPDC059382]|uniref:hypothetical protein n=1 Tax=Streptomyces sp. NPDC059382 TaxID=3346816 RepID=UPI0036C1A4C0